MAAHLEIDSVAIDRYASRVVLHQVTFSMDSPEVLEFSQKVEPACSGDFSAGQKVELFDADYTFLGYITKVTTLNIGSGSIVIGYTAMGLRWLANLVWITSSDGTGSMTWNLPTSDANYIPSRAGKSVGDILKEILDEHATQLGTIGITGYTAGELTALTVVPPEPVTASGRLWDAMADILTQWCPNHAIWSDGAGLVHVKDTSTLPSTTLDFDVDPITLASMNKDHSEAYTQVILRGQANVQAAYLSLAEATLTWAQLPADVASFTVADFYSPKGASDWGNIVSMTSNSITCKSDDPTLHEAVNWASDIGAHIFAFNPLATGITFSEEVIATASTALTAGGTYTIDTDPVFNNSGYTRYQVRGNRTVQSETWRKLSIVPTWVAQHLCAEFNHSFPWSPADGASVQTKTPTGVVCWSSSHSPPYNEFPVQFEVVLPDGSSPGYIVLYQPAPLVYSSQTALNTPGASVGPDDLKVLVPYSRGPLSVTAPAGGGFAGTAFTVDGVQRVYYKDYPTWDDARNKTDMQTLANEVLKSLQDTAYEGSLIYHGRAGSWLTLGKSLNLARLGGSTGWESIAAAVRSVTLEWDGAAIWRTVLNFSSRRRPFSGDRLYIHPAYGSGKTALRDTEHPSYSQWKPYEMAQHMLDLTQARRQQQQEQFTPSVDQGEGLGLGFGGPEKQGMSTAEYNKGVAKLSGEYTPTQREEQRAKHQAAQEEKDVIAANIPTQKEQQHERAAKTAEEHREYIRGEKIGEATSPDPKAEREKKLGLMGTTGMAAREEYLSRGTPRRKRDEAEGEGSGGQGEMPDEAIAAE